MRNLSDFKKFPDYRDHKTVIQISRPEVRLRGFIAIHNDTLGPAVGGTRMYPYKTDNEAIVDVLRLSRAMTYKCALAGVSFGGGKSVIIADPKRNKTPELLRAYAEEINKLRGSFYTGEDVGLDEEDVGIMLSFSPFFIGNKDKAGDPSPYAGLSTYVSIVAASEVIFKSPSLEGLTVAIKGVGKVGTSLIKLLVKGKAKIVVADIDKEVIKKIKIAFPEVEVVDASDIHKVKCDIYSPCALGNEFNEKTIGEMETKIVCGAANNQLENEIAGQLLFDSKVTYVPDYIANSGGLINVVDELNPYGYNAARVKIQIQKIGGLVQTILNRSIASNTPTSIIADSMAQDILENKKNSTNNYNGKKN